MNRQMQRIKADPNGNRQARRAYARITKRPMPKSTLSTSDSVVAKPAAPSRAPAPEKPEPAETPEPAADQDEHDNVHTQQPLTDETRQALVDLARRLVDDPDDLIGDRQQRALDRLHGQQTPECGHRWAGQTCTRPADHMTRSARSRRHVAACGTWRWES